VQMYEMDFTIQIYLQVFSIIFSPFLQLFCIYLWFKSLVGGQFKTNFRRKYTIIYSVEKGHPSPAKAESLSRGRIYFSI
jgi:hypothetical protein